MNAAELTCNAGVCVWKCEQVKVICGCLWHYEVCTFVGFCHNILYIFCKQEIGISY